MTTQQRARPAYAILASLVAAIENCQHSNNRDWENRHTKRAQRIVKQLFPSGSGWDQGTEFVLDESTPEKLVFRGAFHHMNGAGYYDGWTEHDIIVRPSLANGINVHISGRDRNDIKEYLHELFDSALNLLLVQNQAEPFDYVLQDQGYPEETNA